MGTAKVSRAVEGHGTFTASSEAVERFAKLTRPQLLALVCEVYEGTSDKGDKPSHWRGHSKLDLVFVAADAFGMV